MRDVELYQQILGLEQPWSVREVDLNIEAGRVDIQVEHPDGQRGSAHTVSRSCRATTIRRSGHGGIWIRANWRRTCTPGFRGSSARSTAWCK